MSLPPGYAVTAGDDDLARTLGIELHGFLLYLLRQARPVAHPAGAWVVESSEEVLAADLKWGTNKVARQLKDLRRLGLIARVLGKRNGRGMGTDPTRFYLLTDPSMTPPPDGNRHHRNRDPHNRGLQNRGVHSGTLQRPHLVKVTNNTPAIQGDVVNDVNNFINQHEPKSNDPKPDTPDSASVVARHLRDLGWVGPPPDPGRHAADAVIALARWVGEKSNIKPEKRGGYLRRILENEPAADACVRLGVGSIGGASQAVEDRAFRSTSLTPEQYWDQAYADDAWRTAVETEARRIAQTSGYDRVSLALLRSVGAETPFPYTSENPAITGDV